VAGDTRPAIPNPPNPKTTAKKTDLDPSQITAKSRKICGKLAQEFESKIHGEAAPILLKLSAIEILKGTNWGSTEKDSDRGSDPMGRIPSRHAVSR
jgi:hypothetical protein